MVKIGLEVHIPLNKLQTKLFCSCKLPKIDSEPNSHCCHVCLGHPGSKPVLNKTAVENALKLALSLGFEIADEAIFSRKTYFYPDMTKNYQITQYEIPLGQKGSLVLDSGKKVNLKRIHLEEDPGALIHPSGMQSSQYVLIDYNRAGIPLVEVVSDPDMTSPEEAREFLNKLIQRVNYLNIYDSKDATIKADANISVEGGARIEIKNISGFKEISKALTYELEVQKKEKSKEQQTKAWDPEQELTFKLRSKETEEDYGYIFDPDLSIIELQPLIKKVEKEIPELAHQKVQRYIKIYKIPKEDAETIASELFLAELFEKIATKIDPILAAKWLRRELLRVLNYNKKELSEMEIDGQHLIDLLTLVKEKKITEQTAQKIMEKLIEKPFDIKSYVEKNKLALVSSENELEVICKKILKGNEKVLQDYKNGEEKAFNYLVGQVMKETRGRASPQVVNALMKKLIK
ncbi:Asp-tRNA(Asn)/Glu-tRNA(Gln) amidotransferase subunit GatB [Candidatus Woesearchaeota archaeon]|nr:hypothetical protein [uncultured archaeon]MBS3167286.1 Asp-tRNA(Asn)/Glu-tRNA(Gln) amidotransferase subunit GatB [Candidatus Woesearchaeota archaeon]